MHAAVASCLPMPLPFSIYSGGGALAEYSQAPEEYALVLVCPLSVSICKEAYAYRMCIGFSGIVVEGHQNII
jgi:hypothetical protein